MQKSFSSLWSLWIDTFNNIKQGEKTRDRKGQCYAGQALVLCSLRIFLSFHRAVHYYTCMQLAQLTTLLTLWTIQTSALSFYVHFKGKCRKINLIELLHYPVPGWRNKNWKEDGDIYIILKKKKGHMQVILSELFGVVERKKHISAWTAFRDIKGLVLPNLWLARLCWKRFVIGSGSLLRTPRLMHSC